MDPPIHVLHVDDDADFGETVATFLPRENERLAVQTATSAEEGLEILAERDIDCIVSDFDMPGCNGIEFLELVREEHPTMPFVLYTGKGSEEIASEAISAGVTDYLQKEVGTDQYAILANRIANAVSQSRSEGALERTRDYFSTILEQASDYVMVVGDEGHVDYISPAVERVMGYSPDEFADRDAFEYTHPDDQSKASAAFVELFEHPDEDHTVEFRARHADGSWKWLEVRGRNLLDDPVIEGVIVNVRDITDRKERERELARIKERYQAFVEDSSDIITVIDDEGTITYESPSVEQILGRDPETLVGTSIFEYVHPEDRAKVGTAFDQAVDRDDEVTGRVEYRIEREDGSWVWIESVGTDRTETAIEGIVVTSRDITERKRREEKLQRYEYAYKSSLSGIAIANLDNEIVSVNPAVLDMWGFGDMEEVIGRSVAEVWKDPEKAETIIDSIKERGRWEGEIEAVRADGSTFYTRGAASILTDDGGDPLGLMASFVDITERKEYERELERQNERLDEFASVLSHDLRNPLNVAQARMNLAREEFDSEHFEAMARAHGRMESLIGDLLVLAREGKAVTDRVPIDLSAILNSCWANVDTRDATIVVEIDRTVEADPSRLKRVFENLFRNAVEHGGDDVTVTIGELDDGFYVEDDGSGISVGDSDQIFEAGYTTSDGGTGFGLNIVKEIVEAHDWVVGVSEGADGGTRFEITGVGLAGG